MFFLCALYPWEEIFYAFFAVAKLWGQIFYAFAHVLHTWGGIVYACFACAEPRGQHLLCILLRVRSHWAAARIFCVCGAPVFWALDGVLFSMHFHSLCIHEEKSSMYLFAVVKPWAKSSMHFYATLTHGAVSSVHCFCPRNFGIPAFMYFVSVSTLGSSIYVLFACAEPLFFLFDWGTVSMHFTCLACMGRDLVYSSLGCEALGGRSFIRFYVRLHTRAGIFFACFACAESRR